MKIYEKRKSRPACFRIEGAYFDLTVYLPDVVVSRCRLDTPAIKKGYVSETFFERSFQIKQFTITGHHWSVGILDARHYETTVIFTHSPLKIGQP